MMQHPIPVSDGEAPAIVLLPPSWVAHGRHKTYQRLLSAFTSGCSPRRQWVPRHLLTLELHQRHLTCCVMEISVDNLLATASGSDSSVAAVGGNRAAGAEERLELGIVMSLGECNSCNNNREIEFAGDEIRDIHAVTPPAPSGGRRQRDTWETASLRSSELSLGSEASGENFTSMSREFNALVLAGSAINNNGSERGGNPGPNLSRIGEDHEETNPLAIVPDNRAMVPPDPVPCPRRTATSSSAANRTEDLTLQGVKQEETEAKILAWQTAKIAKINNRFKRDEAVISGWESQELEKTSTWMKKVERKLEEKRARALEKMQNEVARARRKAEEKRATAEAKRGMKVAGVLELANLMRAVGRAPTKRSFF